MGLFHYNGDCQCSPDNTITTTTYSVFCLNFCIFTVIFSVELSLFSGSCWNSTESNMQMGKCNSEHVRAAVEALHTRPSLAHVNHCSLCTSGAAAWLRSKADWTSPGSLCVNMHWANRNNIISLRLLWCVFSDPPLERWRHIERSAICSVEWIQKCVCVCSVNPKRRALESYKEKSKTGDLHPSLSLKSRLGPFLSWWVSWFLWDHVKRGWNSLPPPANRGLWNENRQLNITECEIRQQHSHRWGNLVDSLADLLHSRWNWQWYLQIIKETVYKYYIQRPDNDRQTGRSFLAFFDCFIGLIWFSLSCSDVSLNGQILIATETQESYAVKKICSRWRAGGSADSLMEKQSGGSRGSDVTCAVSFTRSSHSITQHLPGGGTVRGFHARPPLFTPEDHS